LFKSKSSWSLGEACFLRFAHLLERILILLRSEADILLIVQDLRRELEEEWRQLRQQLELEHELEFDSFKQKYTTGEKNKVTYFSVARLRSFLIFISKTTCCV
jgi:hypothetical protein